MHLRFLSGSCTNTLPLPAEETRESAVHAVRICMRALRIWSETPRPLLPLLMLLDSHAGAGLPCMPAAACCNPPVLPRFASLAYL